MSEQAGPNEVPPELVPALRRLLKLVLRFTELGQEIVAGSGEAAERAPREFLRLYHDGVQLAEEEPLAFSAAMFGIGCALGYLLSSKNEKRDSAGRS